MGRIPFRWPTVRNGVESSWNVMAHGDAREVKWRGNWRMECVASTFHTTSEHGVSSNTTAHAHTSAASSQLNSRPRRFKWTRPFRRKTKSRFCGAPSHFKCSPLPTSWEDCTAQFTVSASHTICWVVYLQPLFYNKMATQSTTIQRIKYLVI